MSGRRVFPTILSGHIDKCAQTQNSPLTYSARRLLIVRAGPERNFETTILASESRPSEAQSWERPSTVRGISQMPGDAMRITWILPSDVSTM